jgi:transcriptional regulator NrdR family protein
MDNNQLAIEAIGIFLRQIDSMNEEGRIKYSKVYEALKNTQELLDSLRKLNNDEANIYMQTFFAAMCKALENK